MYHGGDQAALGQYREGDDHDDDPVEPFGVGNVCGAKGLAEQDGDGTLQAGEEDERQLVGAQVRRQEAQAGGEGPDNYC
jgi:hypothetical protein